MATAGWSSASEPHADASYRSRSFSNRINPPNDFGVPDHALVSARFEFAPSDASGAAYVRNLFDPSARDFEASTPTWPRLPHHHGR